MRYSEILPQNIAHDYNFPWQLACDLVGIANLGLELVGVVHERNLPDKVQVPIWINDVLIGFMSYVPQEDGSIRVIIDDVENPYGNVLTENIKKLLKYVDMQ